MSRAARLARLSALLFAVGMLFIFLWIGNKLGLPDPFVEGEG